MRLCTAASPSGDAASSGLKGATTRSWNRDEMYQYLASMRKHFAKARPLSVAMDATRVGGHDFLYAAVYSSDLMLGAWLPAQVASKRTYAQEHPFHVIRGSALVMYVNRMAKVFAKGYGNRGGNVMQEDAAFRLKSGAITRKVLDLSGVGILSCFRAFACQIFRVLKLRCSVFL